jgi:hypothetical protein
MELGRLRCERWYPMLRAEKCVALHIAAHDGGFERMLRGTGRIFSRLQPELVRSRRVTSRYSTVKLEGNESHQETTCQQIWKERACLSQAERTESGQQDSV